MKNKYEKPTMAVEMFLLTQSIARDCGDNIPDSQLSLNDANTCYWDMGGGATVFIAGQHCMIDGTKMEFVCYNNPSEGNYIFRS